MDNLTPSASQPCPTCGAELAIGELHACHPEPVGACEDIAARTPGEAIDAPESECFGQFVRVTLIGRGGMGEVWKAWDSLLGRWVALKFLHEVDAHDLAFFQVEAHVASNLAHPNIAAIYDAGEAHDLYFIAMQLVEGRTLESKEKLDPRRAAAFVLDATRAVAHAHAQGVVHRDLKPANLMVTPAGHLYVMDFGLATRADLKGSLTREVVGTPPFMSPEQMKGELPHVQDDIYALGVTLKELLPPKAPAELRRVVSKSTAKDPAQRYQAAGELASDLERFVNRKSMKWLGWAAAVLLAIGATTFMAVYGERRVTAEAARHRTEAEVRLANDDDTGAIEAFTRSLAVKPDLLTYLDRGFCYYRIGEYEKAIADCEAALKIDPNNEAAKKNLVLARKYLKT